MSGSLLNWVDESDQLVESTHSTAATASTKYRGSIRRLCRMPASIETGAKDKSEGRMMMVDEMRAESKRRNR